MSAKDTLIPLLAKTDLFGGLDSQELAACAAAFREARFDKGELIFGRGDPAARLYVGADGRGRPPGGRAGGGRGSRWRVRRDASSASATLRPAICSARSRRSMAARAPPTPPRSPRCSP